MTSPLNTVDVFIQPIELCKLLKIANMVGGGGEAKIIISQGYVLVNDEVEFQKRKKIYHDDIIEFNGETIQVNVVENTEQTKQVIEKKTTTPSNKKRNKNKVQAQSVKKQSHQESNNHLEQATTKRKPISF